MTDRSQTTHIKGDASERYISLWGVAGCGLSVSGSVVLWGPGGALLTGGIIILVLALVAGVFHELRR